jgi:predicted nucleic acid-binding protein
VVNIAARAESLIRISINKEQQEEAVRVAKQRNVPKGDALHSILCRDSECTLITLDEDFLRLKDVTEPKTPSDIIESATQSPQKPSL